MTVEKSENLCEYVQAHFRQAEPWLASCGNQEIEDARSHQMPEWLLAWFGLHSWPSVEFAA
jgi:hypothetical protein